MELNGGFYFIDPIMVIHKTQRKPPKTSNSDNITEKMKLH